jgi:hypothetical protein
MLGILAGYETADSGCNGVGDLGSPNLNKEEGMKALSIKQPWAYLLLGPKDIENRTWPTTFRGRTYIHAGQRYDNDAEAWLWGNGFSVMEVLLMSSPLMPENVPSLTRGAIIGEVDIIDCVTESKSPWFVGPYGFVRTNPIRYAKPIPYKGKLRFFEVTA